MIALPLLMVALAGTPAACNSTQAESGTLVRAAQSGELEEALAGLEAELGGVLLLDSERSSLPIDQAVLASQRLREACALATRAQSAGALPDRALIKAIMDREEFHEAREANADAFERLIAQFQAWLVSFFESASAQTFAGGSRLAVLIFALAVVVGGALRLVQFRRSKPADQVAATDRLAPLELRSPGVHLQLARAALPDDAREASRQGLLGLLSLLEQRQLARPDRVKTNRELAAELPSRGASAELTQVVDRWVRWYDRRFYSLEPVPTDEARGFVDSVEALVLAAPSSRPEGRAG